MSTQLERRLDALEAHQSMREHITIIRIVTLAGDKDPEPARAGVAGGSMVRADDETGDEFLARVKAAAKAAARPGCGGVALVWPRVAECQLQARSN